MCEDLMFVLQGVEGELVRYDPDYDPLDEGSRLRGARWRVDPSLGAWDDHTRAGKSLSRQIHRLCRWWNVSSPLRRPTRQSRHSWKSGE